jgi:hypothetical protein
MTYIEKVGELVFPRTSCFNLDVFSGNHYELCMLAYFSFKAFNKEVLDVLFNCLNFEPFTDSCMGTF